MKITALATVILAALAAVPAANAYEKGDWVVRGGVTVVAPDDSSNNIFAGGADLGIGGVSVDNDTQLGINVAYFITDQINIELLAATPFKHDVNFAGDPLGTGNKVGDVKHLPPTLSVNYYFNDPSAVFQPYVGVGLNYTMFFSEDFTSTNSEAGLSGLDLDDSFGVAAQIGADYMIDKNWHVNASVRWIDIDTEADFKVGNVDAHIGDIQIDPWVYTVSVGYTF